MATLEEFKALRAVVAPELQNGFTSFLTQTLLPLI